MAYMRDANGLKLDAHAAGRARVAVIGDSITYNFDGGPARIAVQRAATRPVWGGHYATQGYTLAQIKANHLPTVLALTGGQKPSHCIVAGGTNDVGSNSGGGIGSGFSKAASKATLLATCDELVRAGIVPVLTTLPPRTDGGTANANVRVWNACVRDIAARTGWPLIDYNLAIATVSGVWPGGSSPDGVHPSGAGNRILGTAAQAVLERLAPSPSPLSRMSYDPVNLLPGFAQLFMNSPSNGVAGGWTTSGAGCVFTTDTTDASIVGAWQTLARPSAGTANAFLQPNPKITAGFSVGDRLALACLYKASGFEANVNQTAYITVTFLNASNQVIQTVTLLTNASDCAVNALAYAEAVVPAGTVSVNFTAGVNGAATTTGGSEIRLAQPTVLNMTTSA